MSMRTWCAVLVGALALGATLSPSPARADENSWLGVYTQEITPALREGMNYNGSGALVSRVVQDSPADRAGVERGDIIVRVGTRSVDSPASLANLVQALPAGRSTELLVVRDDQKKSLNVTLEARDESNETHDFDMEVPTPPESPRSPMPPMPPSHMRHMSRGQERNDREYGDNDNDNNNNDNDNDNDNDHGNDHSFEFQMPNLSGDAYRGRLGVRIESLNPDLASYFGGRDTRGALVLEVMDGTPADKAGIRAGDVITRVNGKTVESADDLLEAVRSSSAQASISLTRHGTRQTMSATLGDSPTIMRLRRPTTSFNWNGNPGLGIPDGKMRHRITIDGDEMNPQVREELNQLREELRKMHQEMNRMDKTRGDSTDD